MRIQDNHKIVNNPAATTFVASLFERFNQENINYAVIRNFDNLPNDIVGDIDILIDPKDKQKVKLALDNIEKETGRKPLFLSGVYPHYQRTYCFEGAEKDIVKLDFQQFIGKAGFVFIDASQLLAEKVKKGSFYVLQEKSRLSILLYHCVIYKKSFSQSYQTVINHIFQKHPTGHIFENQLPKDLNNQILSALKKSDFRALISLREKIILSLLARNPINIFRPMIILLHWLLLRVWRYIYPKGILLCFIGPEGSGKSTIIEKLYDRIKYDPFAQIKKIEMGFQKKGILYSELFYKTHKERFYFRVIWPVLGIVDFYLRYFFSIRPVQAKGGIVLADRYIYNIGVGGFNITQNSVLRKIIFALTPKPDRCYIIKRDYEAIKACRAAAQVSTEEQYRLFESLTIDCLKPINNIDADETTNQVVKELIQLYAQKNA